MKVPVGQPGRGQHFLVCSIRLSETDILITVKAEQESILEYDAICSRSDSASWHIHIVIRPTGAS
jgi:hypothetical protein